MRGKEPSRAEQVLMLARAYPGRTLLVLVVVGIGIWLLAVNLIPSETGNVRATIDQIRDGLVAADVDKVMANVSPYFYQEGIDKAALDKWLRAVLAGKPVDRIYLIVRDVKIQGTTADVDLSVRSFQRVRYGNTDWAVSLEKLDGRWLVREAAPTAVNGYRVQGFRVLFRIY